MLSSHTTNIEESDKLQHLSTPAGSKDYNDFINKEGRSLLDILNTFPSCLPPVQRLLEYLPPLQPRPYSISSSPLTSKEKLHFAISVIEFNQIYNGVCSGWLDDQVKKYKDLLDQNIPFQISFYFRKTNNFKLPDDPATPIIMIGPGTGVAPFIGFLQERHHLKEQNCKIGDSWLFFGCRYSNKDFLYKEEIDTYLKSGILTRLFTSFSREGSDIKYVQHNILKYGKEFANFILKGDAVVYVCGDENNMAKDVKSAIIKCFIDFHGMNEVEATRFVSELENNHRYIQDIWI